MKCQSSLFKCHPRVRLLQFNYGEEKKEFYRFAIKSKTRVYVCVCGRWWPPRGHVARYSSYTTHGACAASLIHFDSFLITFVIKNSEKSHLGTAIWNCTRSLELIPHLSSWKYKMCPLSCAADLLRNNTSVSTNAPHECVFACTCVCVCVSFVFDLCVEGSALLPKIQ